MYRQLPNYTKLRPFGCLCYPWLKPYSPSKLHPKSSRCLFLGYSTSKSAYKCLDIASNRLYHSRHVQFVTHVFPSRDSHTTTTTPTQLDDFLSTILHSSPTTSPTSSTTFPSHANPSTLLNSNPNIPTTSINPPTINPSSTSLTPPSSPTTSTTPTTDVSSASPVLHDHHDHPSTPTTNPPTPPTSPTITTQPASTAPSMNLKNQFQILW